MCHQSISFDPFITNYTMPNVLKKYNGEIAVSIFELVKRIKFLFTEYNNNSFYRMIYLL